MTTCILHYMFVKTINSKYVYILCVYESNVESLEIFLFSGEPMGGRAHQARRDVGPARPVWTQPRQGLDLACGTWAGTARPAIVTGPKQAGPKQVGLGHPFGHVYSCRNVFFLIHDT
jgi:hypothetical protein